jgi:hypothetical protein
MAVILMLALLLLFLALEATSITTTSIPFSINLRKELPKTQILRALVNGVM